MRVSDVIAKRDDRRVDLVPAAAGSEDRAMLRLYSLACVVLFGIAVPSTAAACPYRLKILVSEGDTIGGKQVAYVRSLSVNDAGMVVFIGRCDNGRALLTQTGLIATSGTVIDGKELFSIQGTPQINNDGTIVFQGKYFGGLGYFTDDKSIVALGDTLGGKTLTGFGYSPAVNEAGDVIFYGEFDGGRGVFTQDGPALLEGDTINGETVQSVWRIPDIGDTGEWAVFCSLGGRYGLYSRSGGSIYQGMTIDGRQIEQMGPSYSMPSINASGELLARVRFADGAGGLVTQQRVVVTNGDVISGKALRELDYCSNLNDAGECAFYAYMERGTRLALFTPNCLILAEGDSIEGKTVAKLKLGQRMRMNNRGDIAFACEFTDGTRAIVLAEKSSEEQSTNIADDKSELARPQKLLVTGSIVAAVFGLVLLIWFVARSRRKTDVSRRGRIVVFSVAAFVVVILVAAGDALRDVAMAEWYIWQLDAESDTARKKAVDHLVALQSRRSLPSLERWFRQEPGQLPATLSDYGQALVSFGEPAAPFLAVALQDETVSVRRLAAVALGANGARGQRGDTVANRRIS